MSNDKYKLDFIGKEKVRIDGVVFDFRDVVQVDHRTSTLIQCITTSGQIIKSLHYMDPNECYQMYKAAREALRILIEERSK